MATTLSPQRSWSEKPRVLGTIFLNGAFEGGRGFPVSRPQGPPGSAAALRVLVGGGRNRWARPTPSWSTARRSPFTAPPAPRYLRSGGANWGSFTAFVFVFSFSIYLPLGGTTVRASQHLYSYTCTHKLLVGRRRRRRRPQGVRGEQAAGGVGLERGPAGPPHPGWPPQGGQGRRAGARGERGGGASHCGSCFIVG